MTPLRHLGQRRALAAVVVLALAGAASAGTKLLQLKDKTLVAWVTLADRQQRGGSVLSIIDPRERFDAIVFGEITPGKWMPVSALRRRAGVVRPWCSAST